MDGDGWDASEVGGEDCDDQNAEVNPEGVQTEGLLDMSGWSNKIENDGAWLCYYPGDNKGLYVADLDGDGDDGIVCSNRYIGEDLNAGTYDDDYPPGVVGAFFNPR